MINELYSLSSTLERTGIVTKDWHREYKLLPQVTKKAPCIRIWLTKDGSVYEVESLDAELVQSLRKFGNNQCSFPAFNIEPLYSIIDEKQIDKLEQIEKNASLLDIDEIRSWCVNDNWRGSLSRKIKNSIHGKALQLLKFIEGQKEGETSPIIELINISNRFSNEPNHDLKEALEKCILQKLERKENISLALAILFHAAKDPKKDRRSLSVILDLQDWRQYGYPVASERMTEQINDLLMKSDQSATLSQSKNDETDAFGAPFINVDDPMPNVKLKGFDVTLRTMFAGQPCQHRYRTIENTSYPIARENRARIKKSLEWIADGDKQEVNWQRIDKDEIVFVYPSMLPNVPLKFASIFNTRRDNSAQTEARFERIAEEFINTLKGIPSHEKPDNIQIFTIRKIDKARSKVVFTRNCTPEQFIRAAEEWEIGCRNVPETKFAEQTTPFPLQTAPIINNVWKQSGELASNVERIKYYQGLELLLDDPPQESLICNYLHILLTNSSGMVKYAGNWEHGGTDRPKKITDVEKQKKEVVLLLSLIGLLLYKHGDRKENYMENMAYLVGQLLKISDELHALYCQAVREGNIPPQLVGSSLFAAASENPTQALAQLAVRMNPYITWAKQYRTKSVADKGKESWRAGWYLGLYEDVANQLYSELTNSIRFDDFEKAQFFIGYLASFPKREKATANTTTNNQTDDMGGTNDEQ